MKLTSFLKITRLDKQRIVLSVVAAMWLTLTGGAWAESPALVNIGVGTQGNLVVMNARLINGFTDSITEAIESGVPMTFTYQVELRQENAILKDSLVSSNTIKHKVRYDSLKKIYRFSEIGKGVKRRIATRNKENYQDLMLTLDNIPIGSVRRLPPNEKYYIRVKADLETDRLWFPFNYLFFFLPFNDFDADWAQSSPLSIDPNTALAGNDIRKNSQRPSKKNRKGVSRVIRSFNQ